jgi:hypothetical protein
MRIAVYAIAALVAAVGIVAIIGWFLPVSHEASRSAEINKRPEVVWALIADPNTYQEWWSGADVKTVVVESVPPSKLVTKIVDETQFGGTWTLDISPTPTGSRLTVTERGEIYNVVFRALAKFIFGYTSTMEGFLAAAQKKLGG